MIIIITKLKHASFKVTEVQIFSTNERKIKFIFNHSINNIIVHLLSDGICGLVGQQGCDGDKRARGAHSVNTSSAGRSGDPDASPFLVLRRLWALFCNDTHVRACTHTLAEPIQPTSAVHFKSIDSLVSFCS